MKREWELRKVGLLVCLLAVPWVQSASFGAEETDVAVRAAPENADHPLEGFWPTPRMTEYALRRWSGQVIHDYELNEEQAARLEEMMLRRWPAWMGRNRHELQPLFNEFMENRIAPQPPSPDAVADWAERALKSFDSMREELRAAQSDFRKTLSPTQKMKFDLDVAKMNVGMELFEQKLEVWQQGRYAQHELWDRPHWMPETPAGDSADPHPSSEANKLETAGTEPTQAGAEWLPLDKWESYVASFIKRYSLDQEQITSAWTIMGDLRARAEYYKARHKDEYERIEHKLTEADSDTRETLLARRQDLDQPLTQLFDELKGRLSRLLTDAQRNAAEQDASDRSTRS